ncbi:MAG: alpha/beta hydrolase [Prevotellaceae bacterium]|nr:alpha/beta hydrolase [Prevotellaceae bacterium]
MKKFFLLSLSLLLCLTWCGAMEKEVCKFAVKEGKDLFLTHYYNAQSNDSIRGCVIFVFGGGFAYGERDAKQYQSFFSWLCDNGYDVASIDYRLGMSRAYDDYGWKKGALGKVKRFKTAIEWAREDMLDATTFVVENCERWHIDKSRIIASGSSAGAITCLMAENAICNGLAPAALKQQMQVNKSPYAAVISFAGAIFSMKGHPKWASKPCPMMMFHGNSDKSVPYKKSSMFGKGLWGSAYIYKQLEEMGSTYYFYDAAYESHRMAVSPMNNNRDEIMEFIKTVVEKGKTLQIHKTVRDTSKPKQKTKFSPFVYLSQKG